MLTWRPRRRKTALACVQQSIYRRKHEQREPGHHDQDVRHVRRNLPLLRQTSNAIQDQRECGELPELDADIEGDHVRHKAIG
jgi:hypothetical protein